MCLSGKGNLNMVLRDPALQAWAKQANAEIAYTECAHIVPVFLNTDVEQERPQGRLLSANWVGLR